jgi:hypothetical protein
MPLALAALLAVDGLVVELFLSAEGKHPVGNDHSGVPHFYKTNGLPLADWRDYRELSASVGTPIVGSAK